MKITKTILGCVAMCIIALLIVGCQEESTSGDQLDLEKLSQVFKPGYKNTKSMSDTVGVSSIVTTNQIPQNRNDLEKMRVVVRTYNGSKNAGISVPGFLGAKLAENETNFNVYYLETKVVNTGNKNTVYGCGYSVHYLFKKVEKGISVDNLPSLAASAQLNGTKTQVFYSIQTYGLTGQILTKFFKPTINRNFNVEGFGILQSSIDGIHNILSDSTLSASVRFTPEIIKFVRPYELE